MVGLRSAVVVVAALAARAAWPQGDPLGPEFRVNSYTTNTQNYPALAANPNGGFVVVWQSAYQDGSNFGVFGQRYAGSGTPLGPEFRVNSHSTSHQRSPDVAVDSSGGFVVVWNSLGQDGSSEGVFAQRFDSAGMPSGPEFRVNTYTTGSQRAPAVSMGGSGNFVVVWMGNGQDGSLYGIFGQRYAASGGPLGPEFRVNTYTTNHQQRPAVAADASGGFVVVWDGLGGGTYTVIAGQRFGASGAPVGAEFRVNTYTPTDQYDPAVDSDAAGNFVVAWTGVTGSQIDFASVFAQRFTSAGAPTGPEFRVNTYTTNDQTRSSVAVDASGNFVIAWQSNQQEVGSYFDIYGQRYGSSGAPSGPEFRVNTFTPNLQIIPDVAADSSGNFVVVWQSPQDGFNTGIFGQRYSMIVPVELMHFRID